MGPDSAVGKSSTPVELAEQGSTDKSIQLQAAASRDTAFAEDRKGSNSSLAAELRISNDF